VKIPRPKGSMVAFYIGYFDLVEEFRTSRRVFGAINSTFIALVPKGQDPTTFDEYKTNIFVEPHI
jgi:hypothetical protein